MQLIEAFRLASKAITRPATAATAQPIPRLGLTGGIADSKGICLSKVLGVFSTVNTTDFVSFSSRDAPKVASLKTARNGLVHGLGRRVGSPAGAADTAGDETQLGNSALDQDMLGSQRWSEPVS